MNTMKCSQLGGPDNCEHEFKAETFDEIAEQSRKHAMEMIGEMMQDPEAKQKWMDEKKQCLRVCNITDFCISLTL